MAQPDSMGNHLHDAMKRLDAQRVKYNVLIPSIGPKLLYVSIHTPRFLKLLDTNWPDRTLYFNLDQASLVELHKV